MKQTLTPIVGNHSLKQKIYYNISSGVFSHAYIIEGKKGSGKHTLAYLIAAALSCKNIHNEDSAIPCLTCASCRRILEKKSPDVIVISREEDKATLGVDTIRFLRDDVNMVPTELETKIYIIEDADTMTDQAQNAFLLTLESPPSFVKFFILCENSENLLETIKSRAARLCTEPIDTNSIDEFLQNNNSTAKQLKLSDTERYHELLMASENSIGRALELLNEKEFDQVASYRALARDFLSIIASGGDSQRAISNLAQFDKKRENVINQLLIIETALRDLIAIQRTENAPLLFFYDREEALSISDAINIRRLIETYASLKKLQEAISQNSNIRLSLTGFFSEINII